MDIWTKKFNRATQFWNITVYASSPIGQCELYNYEMLTI